MNHAFVRTILAFTFALLCMSLQTAFAQVTTGPLTLSHQNNPSSCYILYSTALAPGQRVSAVWSGFGGCTLAVYDRNTGALIRGEDGQALSVSRNSTRRTGNTVSLDMPANISRNALEGAVLLVKNHSWDYDISVAITTPASVNTMSPPAATTLTPTYTRNPITGIVTAHINFVNPSSLGIEAVSYTVSDRTGLLTYGISTIAGAQGIRLGPNRSRLVSIILPPGCSGITILIKSEAYSGTQSITRNYSVR